MKVGILGGGQLARMIALAGYPLGLQFIILDPSSKASAVNLGKHLHGDYDDPALLEQLANEADVVTYEFENVPADVAHYLTEHTQIYPAANALEIAQDRLVEKNYLRQLHIPTADYAAVDSLEQLQQAIAILGYPAILKSRCMGYDGKGQVLLKSADDLRKGWQQMRNVASIVEGFVPFQREVSIIAARRTNGEIVFYPLSENLHSGGILRVAESCLNDPMQTKAEAIVAQLLNALNYVGVIALELFDVDGTLIANEYAPRVHNSGHWTIEGAATSQFENHLRAILNLPLGSTTVFGHAGMVNFIGDVALAEQILNIKNTHLHLYNKLPRKGRKVAHATVNIAQHHDYTCSLEKLIALAASCDNS